jgi:hypothetical protein
MEKIKLSQFFVFVSALSFIVILVVIVQNSYNNLMGPSNTIMNDRLIKPINPNLDVQTIKNLESLPEFPVSNLDFAPRPASSSSTPTTP